MYIRYKLYRSSKPDEMFNAEMIQVNIENDDHLARIDEVIQGVLTQHLEQLPEVKHFGIGYVGKMDLVNIEITDDDNVNLTEEAFRHYMSTIMPNLEIVWSQTEPDSESEVKEDE